MIDKLTIAAVSFIAIQNVINCITAVVNLTTAVPINNISNIFYSNVTLHKILFL